MLKNLFGNFVKDESGMGVVEVILIIVVLTGLVILFQSNIRNVVSTILNAITRNVNNVIK